MEEEYFIHKIRKLQTPGWKLTMPKKEPIPEKWNVLPSNPADPQSTHMILVGINNLQTD